MMWLTKLFGWLTGGGLQGALDRALDTVDRRIEAETSREKIKADLIETMASEHMRTRAGWLAAGGFWTLMLFAVPTAIHYAAVTFYSILWCAGCAWPQEWTIAALPGPMAEWEGWIVLASIGGLSLLGMRR